MLALLSILIADGEAKLDEECSSHQEAFWQARRCFGRGRERAMAGTMDGDEDDA